MDDRVLVETLRSGDPRGPGLLFDRYPWPDLRPLLPDAQAPPRCRGHRPGDLRPRAGRDRRVRRGPSAPALAPGDRRQPLPDRAGPPGSTADPRRIGRGVGRSPCRGRRPRRPGRRAGAIPRDDSATTIGLVFVLFHEQGLPYEEIASVVGRPVGTVKTWLHRARAQLADDLSRRGVRC